MRRRVDARGAWVELVGVRILCVGVAEEATEQILHAARLEESAGQWAGGKNVTPRAPSSGHTFGS